MHPLIQGLGSRQSRECFAYMGRGIADAGEVNNYIFMKMNDHLSALSVDQLTSAVSRVVTAVPVPSNRDLQCSDHVNTTQSCMETQCAANDDPIHSQSNLRPLLPAPNSALLSSISNTGKLRNAGKIIMLRDSNHIFPQVTLTSSASVPSILSIPIHHIPSDIFKAESLQHVHLPSNQPSLLSEKYTSYPVQHVETEVSLCAADNSVIQQPNHVQDTHVLHSKGDEPAADILSLSSGHSQETSAYSSTAKSSDVRSTQSTQNSHVQHIVTLPCSADPFHSSNISPLPTINNGTTQIIHINQKGSSQEDEDHRSHCSVTDVQNLPKNVSISQSGLFPLISAENTCSSSKNLNTLAGTDRTSRETMLMSPSALNELETEHQVDATIADEAAADKVFNIQNLVSGGSPSYSIPTEKENQDLHSTQGVLDNILWKHDIHAQVNTQHHSMLSEQEQEQSNQEQNAEIHNGYPLSGYYCVDCSTMLETQCATHVEAEYTYVSDSPIPSQAQATLPKMLCFRFPAVHYGPLSPIPDGILSCSDLAARTQFGPLTGQKQPLDNKIGMDIPGYWKIFQQSGENLVCNKVLVCKDPNMSNWLMYMRRARSSQEQNVVAYQKDEQIYFVTTKPITTNTELLYWFSSDYAAIAGICSHPEEYLNCHLCKKQLSDHNALQRHLKYIHPDMSGRKFKCKVCTRGFTSSTKLNTHMHSHLGLRPHKCTACHKTFADQSNLRTHLKIHTGEKQFVCDICSRAFRQKAHLTSHLLVHSGEKNLKCSYCKRHFARSSDLKQHELQHTQDKKYTCHIETCRKTFFKQQNFKKHLKVHAGIRDFLCNGCQKGFFSKFHLKRHQSSCKGMSEGKKLQQSNQDSNKMLQRLKKDDTKHIVQAENVHIIQIIQK